MHRTVECEPADNPSKDPREAALLVDPKLFLVLTGPSGSPEPRRELERLRAACLKPAGQPPMWVPEPVLISFCGTPEQVREHVCEVEPALARGVPVVLKGGWWPNYQGDSMADAIVTGPTAWGARCPTLTIAFPHDGFEQLSQLTDWAGPAAVALQPGHEAELSLQVFAALARRGLYRANGWLPCAREKDKPTGHEPMTTTWRAPFSRGWR